MTQLDAQLDARTIAVMRGLAMDGPHAAKSGHQGTAMSLSPLAHVLFSRIMNFDSANPCLLYTSPSPRDRQKSRMPSSA